VPPPQPRATDVHDMRKGPKDYADELRGRPGQWKKWPEPRGLPIPVLNRNAWRPNASYVNGGYVKELPKGDFEARHDSGDLWVRYKGAPAWPTGT
jgi:hypothetical protein